MKRFGTGSNTESALNTQPCIREDEIKRAEDRQRRQKSREKADTSR